MTAAGRLDAARTPMRPEDLRDLELRAGRVHPDEPCASAAEVLALVRSVQELGATVAMLASAVGRVRALARRWKDSRDIQTAAAGRMVLDHADDDADTRA